MFKNFGFMAIKEEMLYEMTKSKLKQSVALFVYLICATAIFFLLATSFNQQPDQKRRIYMNRASLGIMIDLNAIIFDWFQRLNITELYNLIPLLIETTDGCNALDSNNQARWLFDESSNNLENLFHNFNLTNERENFDPETNTNDRILLLHLRLIYYMDLFLCLDRPISPIESEIDFKRKLGINTNLKMIDFRRIKHILHGVRLCESDSYGANLSLVVFVFTKPEDFRIRSLIRITWAQKFQQDETIRLYFVFGRKSSILSDGERIQKMIDEEYEHYQDIIQWAFLEDYFRLTLKSLAIMRWTSVYCPLAENVFKVDADALVNYDNLLIFLKKLKQRSRSQTTEHLAQIQPRFSVYGQIWNNTKVIRTHKNKFYTSFKDYSRKTYPLYTGSAWLLNGRHNSLFIYLTAMKYGMPALLWEDIYITGIIPEHLKRLKIPFEHHQLPAFRFNHPWKSINACLYNKSIIFTEQIKEDNLESVWLKTQKPSNCTLKSISSEKQVAKM